MQPALHMAMTESRECDASPGMMWAVWAPGGSLGRSRVQVWVNCTLSPLGRRAMRGTVAGMMLEAGALVVRKWLVAPELRMAQLLMVVASVDIVLRRMVAASAWFWVGIGQQVKLTEMFNLSHHSPLLVRSSIPAAAGWLGWLVWCWHGRVVGWKHSRCS